MRITIVQGAFLPIPPLMGGAVEKIWHGLAAEFARNGHQVTHISRAYGDLPAEESQDGIRYLRVPGYDTPGSLLHLKLLDLIYALRAKRALPPADILVTHTFWLPMLVRNARHGKLYVHVQRYPKGQMRLYAHAARIQTVSAVISEAILRQAPGLGSRVTVIPNPLPDNAFADDAHPSKLPRERTLLYVGRVHPEKGIGLLIAAFRQMAQTNLPDWRLKIVGPWETRMGGGGVSYYDQLRRDCDEISARVEWVGPVFEPDRLRRHYQQAGLFVYPSLAARGEAAPLAPIEAMACGCPVVVSNLECFRDYLQTGDNGFTFDHEAAAPDQELALVLRNLIASDALRQAAAVRGLQTAERHRMSRVAAAYLCDFQAAAR